MSTQTSKKRRWPILAALGIGGVIFVGGCSALMVATPHPDQYRVQPVPTLPMPIVPDAIPNDQTHMGTDGQFQVGTDIAAGQWKTPGKADGPMGCSINVRNKDGRSVDDVKYSDGPIYVTVHNGQIVEVRDCQPLVLVKAASK
jgi:hypothetical protein